MDNATIAAIATPAGYGGIGIIKISGSQATAIAEKIFRRTERGDGSGDQGAGAFLSHRLYLGHIVDPSKTSVIDEVLLTVMRSPRSYTKEDVVEIQAHAGPVVMRSILELVLKNGARLAEPGEFTRRSFIAGRIDLTQAEAVMDLITAKTEASLEIAAAQMRGEIKRRIASSREVLISILTETEAAIDFPDESQDIIPEEPTQNRLQRFVIEPLRQVVKNYERAHVFRDGIKLVIAGKPNVGKSSLLNRLLQEDRAIVTPVPGTTRDIVEGFTTIRGVPVSISDTAGLHQTTDIVELIGNQKTREHIQRADLVLFVVDAGASTTTEDLDVYGQLEGKDKIIVLNKADLLEGGCDYEPPRPWRGKATVLVSALCGAGIDDLETLIGNQIGVSKPVEGESMIVPNLRQKRAVERALQASESAAQLMEQGWMMELVAVELTEAIDVLGEIIGVGAKADILDEIFSRFCVGK